MLIPHVLLYAITGGDSSWYPKQDRKGKRTLRQAEEGLLVDNEVDMQNRAEEKRAKAKQAELAKGRRRKTPRVPLNKVSERDYIAIRRHHWYSKPRDETITDTSFWNKVQQAIFEEIYDPMSYKVCPMHVLDFEQFEQREDYFAEAVAITKQLGLHKLMKTRCHTS